MAKVSIIVAAYNVADYIREALDSAVGQTLQDIEIVCVDDGSTDGTAEILQEYAARDSRVRVIRHEKNGGTFAVRHTGVMEATGEYVLFLDGDDFYAPQACERLYEKAVSEKLDVVDSGERLFTGDGSSLEEGALTELAAFCSHAPKRIPKNREELLHACFVEKDIRWSMCGKLCLLKLMKKACAFFGGERILMAEDALAAFMVFYHARAYGYLDELFYYYRSGSGVTAKSLPPSIQRLESCATEYQVYGLLCRWLTPAQRAEPGVAEALEALRINLQNDIFYYLQLASVENSPAFVRAILQYRTLEEFVCDLAETAARVHFTKFHEIALRLRDCEELFPRQKEIRTVASFYYRLAGGGVERVIALLAPIWQNAGYQVVIITEQEPTPLDFPLPEGVRRVTIPEGRNGKTRVLAWQRIIREYGIDAVVYHAWGSDGRIMDALAIKSQRIPFILHTHGSASSDFYYLSTIPIQQEATDALSDVVVTLSEVDQAWWQALGYRSVSVSNPLTYHPKDVQPSALQGHHVLWIARLSWEKQYYDAFEIALLVHREIPQFQLHIIGGAESDKDFERIQNYLDENRMSSYVILHGFQTNVEKYFHEAAAILLTSKYEGCPMAVMESKAFGLPLVTYELPNVSAIRKEEGMFVVPQRDRQAAADRIVQLLEDEELRRRMGAEARRSAQALAEVDFGALWKRIFKLAAAPRERHQPLYRQPPIHTALCLAMQRIGTAENDPTAEYRYQIEFKNAQYAVMVQEIQNSTAYRLGMLLTAFPRWLKSFFGKRTKR